MNSLYMHNNRGILVYYVFLLLVLLTWTNPYVLPPMAIRVVYLLLASVPVLLRRKELFPLFFCSLVIVSMSRYAPSYMVSTPSYVFVTIAFFSILFPSSNDKKPFLLFILGVYMLLINMIMGGEFKDACLTPIYTYLLYKYLRFSRESTRLFIATFIIISFILSIEFLIVGKDFTEIYSTDDFERMGWMDPNVFGCIIGIGILCSCLSLIYGLFKFRFSKLILFGIVLVSFMAFLVNASRGAALALVTAIVSLILLMPGKARIKVFSVFFLGFVLLVMYYGGFFDNLFYRMSLDNVTTGGERTIIWKTRLSAFFGGDFSFLHIMLGLGDREASYLAYDYYLGYHNDYIAMFIKYGVLGLVLLLSLLLYPLKTASSNRSLVIVFIIYLGVCIFSLDLINTGQVSFYYLYLFLLVLGNGDDIKAHSR